MRKTLVFAAVVALGSAGCGGSGTSPGGGGGGGAGGGGDGGGGYGGGVGGQCPAGTVCLLGTSFDPVSLTVARNASVSFLNNSGTVHNVTFESNPSPGVSNIPNHSSGSNSRTFSTIGTWQFNCTNHAGMNGQIVVQ